MSKDNSLPDLQPMVKSFDEGYKKGYDAGHKDGLQDKGDGVDALSSLWQRAAALVQSVGVSPQMKSYEGMFFEAVRQLEEKEHDGGLVLEAVAREREACAKLVEDEDAKFNIFEDPASEIAAAIRARGEVKAKGPVNGTYSMSVTAVRSGSALTIPPMTLPGSDGTLLAAQEYQRKLNQSAGGVGISPSIPGKPESYPGMPMVASQWEERAAALPDWDTRPRIFNDGDSVILIKRQENSLTPLNAKGIVMALRRTKPADYYVVQFGDEILEVISYHLKAASVPSFSSVGIPTPKASCDRCGGELTVGRVSVCQLCQPDCE